MALIICPECKSEVSNNALNCPKCGKQIRIIKSLREKITRIAYGGSLVLFCILWIAYNWILAFAITCILNIIIWVVSKFIPKDYSVKIRN